jgi:glutathione S-transferase
VADIILHHYPQSPVSEKVRVARGMKNAHWRSVQIPRLPPKPDLMPLTGGYRRTPVMQVGADIYCDSQCIIRELERRCPQPTLYPNGAGGLPWALSRWTDGALFTLVVSVVMGAQADELPEAFAADRGRLYLGPGFDWQAQKRDLPHTLAQIRAQLGWMEARLSGGRDFMLGADPGLPDALCYHLVWFLRGRYAGGPALIDQFPNLAADRVLGDTGDGGADGSAGSAGTRTGTTGRRDAGRGWRRSVRRRPCGECRHGHDRHRTLGPGSREHRRAFSPRRVPRHAAGMNPSP